jgi:RNA polymerase sigma-70 factor (ECF subfamily)
MDEELVIRAQGGDREAFALIARPLYPRLLRIASSIMGDPAAAEDATQQAMLDVWRKLPQLREPARFEAWCYRTVTNACHDEGRRRRRWLRDTETPSLLGAVAPDGTIRVEQRDILERCFEGLSTEHRTVLVLHYVADMTQAHMAEVLDVPVGTVRSRLSRAIEALRLAIDAETRADRVGPVGREAVE